jgi:hypothetical protein
MLVSSAVSPLTRNSLVYIIVSTNSYYNMEPVNLYNKIVETNLYNKMKGSNSYKFAYEFVQSNDVRVHRVEFV